MSSSVDGKGAQHDEFAVHVRDGAGKSSEEKKLVRKIDLYLMCSLWILYLFSYMVSKDTKLDRGLCAEPLFEGPHEYRKREGRWNGHRSESQRSRILSSYRCTHRWIHRRPGSIQIQTVRWTATRHVSADNLPACY